MKCPYMKTVIDYTHTSTVYNSDGLVKEVISQNIYIDNMRGFPRRCGGDPDRA